MKNLKSRFLNLTVSMIMAVAVMMIAPAIMGAFSQQDSRLVFQQACAVGEEEEEEGSGDGSCCPKNAICGLNGLNYPGFHFVDGSCPPDEVE